MDLTSRGKERRTNKGTQRPQGRGSALPGCWFTSSIRVRTNSWNGVRRSRKARQPWALLIDEYQIRGWTPAAGAPLPQSRENLALARRTRPRAGTIPLSLPEQQVASLLAISLGIC